MLRMGVKASRRVMDVVMMFSYTTRPSCCRSVDSWMNMELWNRFSRPRWRRSIWMNMSSSSLSWAVIITRPPTRIV